MQYVNKQFSVAMPGAKVSWPFRKRNIATGFVPGLINKPCPACGAIDRPGDTHIAAGHTDRPRKRVCFGLKDSQ
jgi:hypothetical protein